MHEGKYAVVSGWLGGPFEIIAITNTSITFRTSAGRKHTTKHDMVHMLHPISTMIYLKYRQQFHINAISSTSGIIRHNNHTICHWSVGNNDLYLWPLNQDIVI